MPFLLVPVPEPTLYEAEEITVIRDLQHFRMLDTFRLLPEKKQKRFAELLRNFNQSLSYNYIRLSDQTEQYQIPWEILIALGDPVTGKYLIKELFRDTKSYNTASWEVVSEWRSAQIIKELGPVLVKNDSIWGRALEPGDMNFDTRERAFSSHFSEFLLYVISEPPISLMKTTSAATYFPELPSETKASMKAFYLEWKEARKEIARNYKGVTNDLWEDALTESYAAIRHTMRAWWLANKESFLAEKYDEVKPLDEATTIHPPKALRIQHDKAAPPMPAPAPAVIPSAPEPAQKPSGNYAIYAMLTALLAVIALFLYNRFLRKK